MRAARAAPPHSAACSGSPPSPPTRPSPTHVSRTRRYLLAWLELEEYREVTAPEYRAYLASKIRRKYMSAGGKARRDTGREIRPRFYSRVPSHVSQAELNFPDRIRKDTSDAGLVEAQEHVVTQARSHHHQQHHRHHLEARPATYHAGTLSD